MQKLFILLLFVAFSTHAQQGWVNYPIDRNAEVLFPGTPVIEKTDEYLAAIYDLPEVTLSVVKFSYTDTTTRVRNATGLKEFYELVLDTRISESGGVMQGGVSVEMQRDIMTATAPYSMDFGETRCRLRVLFVKETMYVFKICGETGNAEHEKLGVDFFKTITINNDLTPEDQMIPPGKRAPVSALSPPVLFAFFCIGLFFGWAILFVILVAKSRHRAPSRFLLRLFAVVRWTLIILFLGIGVCVLIIYGGRFITERRHDMDMAVTAAIFIVLGMIPVLLKTPSPTKAVI
jgi:hypothetical protein